MIIDKKRERQIIAADAVGEIAQLMVSISANLFAAACAVDAAAIEADLWSLQLALSSAIMSWRDETQ